jgi:signal transduction histidine kinase
MLDRVGFMNLWLQFGLMMMFPLGALVLIIILLRRHAGHRNAALIVAFILNGFWASGLAADFVGRGVSLTLVFWWHKAAVYALPLASAAVLFATLTYLRVKLPQRRRWLYGLAGGLVVVAILDPGVIPLGLPDLHVAGRIISHRGWWRIAWTILWAVPSTAALWSIVINYPREAGPLHRNRVRYWAVTTGVNVLGDLLVITWQPIMMQAGAAVKLLAAIIATVSVLVYRPPDMRDVLRRAAVVLAGGAVTLIAFAGAMVGGSAIQREVQEPRNALWAMVGVALLMMLVYFPVRYLVQRGVERTLFRDVFDLDAVLRGYGERISHVLDLEQLAETMIETVDKTLRIDHGALVMVRSEEDGRLTFSPVTAGRDSSLPSLTCRSQSPLVQRLVESCEPLTHYDIDMLPDFAGVSESEREVIKQWGGELYLPIRARGEVVAVLALSTKRSGDPYLDHEILLLQTLGDQTAVALENARLFADLKALNREITELNQSLERANLELSELDRLKSSFIGTITHELRSPFVPVDLALQVIERHGLEHMLPEQRDQIEQLRESLAGLRHMIDNLISFASLVSKQRPLQLQKISLGEIVHDAVKTLEVMATARRVSIAVVQVEGLPPVQADRERISDAVYHLVHNGIKFNRSGGTVGVRCDYRDGRVMIEVTDTGRGIPADRLDSLGDAFTQLADPMKRGIEGIGLGLALVKYIVQAHGGELIIESELGVGSTFTMVLPVGGPARTRRAR